MAPDAKGGSVVIYWVRACLGVTPPPHRVFGGLGGCVGFHVCLHECIVFLVINRACGNRATACLPPGV